MMSKDYARRRARQSASGRQSRRWSRLGIGLLIGLCLAGLAAFHAPILYLIKDQFAFEQSIPQSVKAKSTPVGAPVIKPNPAQQPIEYRFYTELPKDVPKADDQVARHQELVPGYYLQVSSVLGDQAYARMEDRMGVLGFATHPRHIESRGQDWIQVLVGPYHTLAAAHDAKNLLLRVHVKSLLRIVR